MKLKLFTLIAIIPVLVIPIRAEAALTLEQCVDLALKNHPRVQSHIYRHRAALARVNMARALPQPEIGLDFDLQPGLFDFSGSGESYIGINQLIEFPGKRHLRKKIAGKAADETLCDARLDKVELIFQVKRAFYRLILAGELQKYAEENLRQARDFLDKAREKYDAGDVSRLEPMRAGVEAARSENRVNAAAREVKLARAGLNYLLAREIANPIQIEGVLRTPFPALDLENLRTVALEMRPGIKKIKLSLEAEKLSKKHATMNYLPDFSLGVARHRITGETTTWDVTLGFQFPLFFWQIPGGEIAEARANISALEAELQNTVLSVSLEVEQAFQDALALQKQIEFYEKQVLKEAEEVFRMSGLSYKEGKIGGIELIQSRRTLIEVKQSYAETLFNYQSALAELEKNVGGRIPGGKNE